jgi:hypothetical protein
VRTLRAWRADRRAISDDPHPALILKLRAAYLYAAQQILEPLVFRG